MSEQAESDIQQAVADGGAYEVIRKRLQEQGRTLQNKITQLNTDRSETFGQTDLKIIGRVRVRTENNCVPRDIIRVGKKQVLFGYNVFIGMKQETHIEDVFGLYKLIEAGDSFEIEAETDSHNFLSEPKFIKDFKELYQYYKSAHLLSLHTVHEKLLAVFQIGQKTEDTRVFRWQIEDDQVSYIDNRGYKDLQHPSSHDFEWLPSVREDHIEGAHPHISILDQVFVETINGDLTIKVEDNTEDGLGIYREPVDDQHQSMADAEVLYAEVGSLILLKIKPYREEDFRYLIFNTRNQQVNRIDALGQSCVQLPDDHGLMFPGGYYLQNGETKLFDNAPEGLEFSRSIRSPNGEDVVYLFYEPVAGISALFSYNLIDKSLQNPIYAHGVCLFRDGQMVVFRAEDDDPARIHPMQVWETPYFNETFALQQPADQSFFGKIGNSELVRGVSEGYSLIRSIESQQVSQAHYEDLIAAGQRMLDAYHWLNADDIGNIEADIRQISTTAELVLDEFEKVESIRQQADQALAEADTQQQVLLKSLYVDNWKTAQEFVDALDALRRQQGHLTTIQSLRYMNGTAVEALQTTLAESLDSVGQDTVQFLHSETALTPYHDSIAECLAALEKTTATVQVQPLAEQLDAMSQSLDLLNETLAGLSVEDAQVRTAILESLSELYSKLNQAKAQTRHKSKSFRSGEAVAEFAAQFKLFSHSISSALETADSPQQCDDQLSRLLTQLEELESRFSDYDEFLTDIVTQREQLFETFQTRKQALMDERQRRTQNLVAAADRVLSSVQRRSQTFREVDELNTYFASDAMVMKLRQLVEQMNELEASVQADDAQSRLKAAQEQAIRALRDQQDIYEDGGAVIKMGKHRFSVNRQALDLTLIARDDEPVWHLIGTDFYEAVEHTELATVKDYWHQALVSETEQVYRAEYLAASILHSAEQGLDKLDMPQLLAALKEADGLLNRVRQYATSRYQEGYEKGIHDVDAARILEQLLSVREAVDLLRFTPEQRALAIAYWCLDAQLDTAQKARLSAQAQSAVLLQQSLANTQACDALAGQLEGEMQAFVEQQSLNFTSAVIAAASRYLLLELAQTPLAFITSANATQMAEGLMQHLHSINHQADFEAALQQASGQIQSQWQLIEAWLQGWLQQQSSAERTRFIPEAVMVILAGAELPRRNSDLALDITLEQLLGEHPRIQDRTLTLSVDTFDERLRHHRDIITPGYQQFLTLRQTLIDDQRNGLRLDSFKPKPLASFVRNKLINEVYLPLIGDNLAKQMGTVGENKRTDLMGLLLLISPPGYGKTTLMEYIANRLGLIFMKINGPSLGHEVHSLDPTQAPNAAAAQELEKLNLGLEMGNNVMLYVDDIQHTHPEFLQKFISLCDGSRRIEGIWKGDSKTYDMRGKKFCVVMAGNPYTESGESFSIPDMLANRADIYNLGDVLSGSEASFALSYLENALTSNPVLQPLATRSMEDVYRFVRRAEGETLSDNAFEHSYAGSEVNEIVSILQKLLKIRDVVLGVNQAYIVSAAQDDRYRTEPPFKLQGSYRNMNKMAEKVTAVLNEAELQALIDDHYVGEAQTLTKGAEENLLKLKAIRAVLSETETERWQMICEEYARLRELGDDNDPAVRMANQLSHVVEQLSVMGEHLQAESSLTEPMLALNQQLGGLHQQMVVAQQQVAKQLSGIGEHLQAESSLTEPMQELNRHMTVLHQQMAVAQQQVAEQLSGIGEHLQAESSLTEPMVELNRHMTVLHQQVAAAQMQVEVVNQPVPGVEEAMLKMAKVFEESFLPVVSAMEHKIRMEHDIWERVKGLEKGLKSGKRMAGVE